MLKNRTHHPLKGEVEAIIELLEQANRPGWFRWLFLHGSRHKTRKMFIMKAGKDDKRRT